MATQQPETVVKQTCPCKKLPLCFSSFTAAEYGDLHTLSKLKESAVERTDAGGYTPLHLAAQNGHTAATALLLKSGLSGVNSNSCGATPLHRASFSGAVTTMQLLLDAGAELMVRDTSFGDKMTPLHKAAAGGRHLAVKLLLHYFSKEGIVEEGLTATASRGQTPIEVAQEMALRKEAEHQSVKRWDVVAGGPPDWDECILLLENAARSSTRKGASLVGIAPLPSHLSASTGIESCLDCESDGRCLTASWETAFMSVLTASNQTSQRETNRSKLNDEKDAAKPVSMAHEIILPSSTSSITKGTNASAPSRQIGVERLIGSSPPKGKNCAWCGLQSVAFFRVDHELVCATCAKPTRRRRVIR